MKTVFRVGMVVYDQVFFPDVDGRIVEIHNKNNKIQLEVKFFSKYRLEPLCMQSSVFYTEKGNMINVWGCNCEISTLSTKPYKIEFQGFEQKAPAPEFHEALSWLDNNENYQTVFEDERTYPSKEIYKAFEGLRKLIILRDYYNEGWQPDWKDTGDKYCIQVYKGELNFIEYSFTFETLHFKTREIRERFFKEQKELLEIAKPLL